MSTLQADLDTFERALLRQALDRNGCDARATAKELGISERNLWRRLARLGMSRKPPKS